MELARRNPRARYPKIWEYLESLIEAGLLCAPREVRKEIERGDDELVKWARTHKGMFRDPDDSQREILESLLKKFPTLVDPNREGPFADPWVVAIALSLNSGQSADDPVHWVVVADELPKGPGSTKIPDICADQSLEAINILALFAER